MRLRTGSKLDSIQATCSNGAQSGRIGGSGGSSDKVYACPSTYPAVKGLRMRSGDVINSIGLVCSDANGNIVVNWY
ncbi:MAG: hypothetical protein ACRCYY_04750 [Trueperaceae bacterium]